jgi:hypothetical protein
MPWGPLREEVADALARIPASFDTYSGLTFHPSGAVLENGRRCDAVIFLRLWPDEADWAQSMAAAGRCLQPEEVVGVYPSPTRIPAVLADRLYEVGAATRHEYAFGLQMKDGERFSVRCTQVVDFVSLPDPYTPAQIRDVLPDQSNDPEIPSAPFHWCFYIWPRLPGDPEG